MMTEFDELIDSNFGAEDLIALAVAEKDEQHALDVVRVDSEITPVVERLINAGMCPGAICEALEDAAEAVWLAYMGGDDDADL